MTASLCTPDTTMTHPIRSLGRLSALALSAALSSAPAAALPSLAITGPAAAAPGSSFALAINASGFDDLYAYQFDIVFDPALFSATAVSQGGFLGTAGASFFDGGSIDAATGTVSFVFESLIGPGAGAAGAGTLATLHLVATSAVVAPGSSGRFSLQNVIAYDAALNPVAVALQDHVTAVPEPATWALGLGGLLGLAALRRVLRPALQA